jgi:O-acetyl-ADP-ribose deacetylase (regulator of RNase III)
MIEYVSGKDIIHARTMALVNPVNCVGVMGSGLAADFKKNFPAYFLDYKKTCMANLMQVGRMHVYNHNGPHVQYLISFPTKTHWSFKSSMGYIEVGLIALKKTIDHHHITSISLPKLGCGLGGLKWKNVKAAIEEHLKDSSARIVVYE